MYRVMIIDDETSARKLLYSSIDWNGLGLEFAGEAASGIEAINVIDDLKPDIVFVDIFMPFMNGIEFTKVATSRYPDLIIVVLTGFDDFEYARQCVSLPVVEYMLKPIVRKDVHEVLLRVKGILDGRKMFAEPEMIADDGQDSSVLGVEKYLKKNFTDSNLNLTSVAQQFGFNSSYLSRRFKQETGMSFVDFLLKCRMEKAIELAKAGKKMFCTASEVGIPDPNYFSKCFKKYTGKSYSEFQSGAPS